MKIRLFISESRNLLDNVKSKCAEIATQVTTNPNDAKWINTIFKNWLQNEGPATLVKKLAVDAPDWAKSALDKNDLYSINWDEVLAVLNPILDYFRYLRQQGSKYDAMTVPEAIKQQIEYHESLKKKAALPSAIVEDGMEPVHTFDDGYYWAKLSGRSSLDREGELMGHCVGSYYDEVKSGTTEIYSLRDTKNLPHITIETSGKSLEVVQIKGKQNDVVVEKYRPYIPPFLAGLDLNYICTDESGFSAKELNAYFKKNNAFRKNDKKNLLFSIHLSTGILDCSQSKSKISQASMLPVISDIAPTAWRKVLLLHGRDGLEGVEFDLDHTMSLEDIEEKLPQPLTPLDRVRILSDVRQYSDKLLTIGHKDSVALGACTILSKKFTKGFSLRVPTNKDASVIMGEPCDFLLFYKEYPVACIAQKCIEWARNTRFLERQYPGFEEMFYKHLSKFDYSHLNRITQSKVQAAKQAAKSKPQDFNREEGLSYKRVPPTLVKAILVFWPEYKEEVKAVCKELDSGDIRTVLRSHGFKNVGYLYTYFNSFLAIALMSDKAKSVPYILNQSSMMRQFSAFTADIASIKAGSFWYRRGVDTQEQIAEALTIIAKFMPKMVPLTASEKETLLAIKGSPRFKKAIQERF